MAQAPDLQPDIGVVAQAENGEEAVHLFAAHHPDIVLIDINTLAVDRVTAARASQPTFRKQASLSSRRIVKNVTKDRSPLYIQILGS